MDLNRAPLGTQNAPGNRGRFSSEQLTSGGWLGSLLLLDHPRLAGTDLDLAWLSLLGHLVHKIDMQHAVHQGGADDLDMVGEAKAPLERAPGDPAVQITAVLVFFFRLTRHLQRVLVHGDIDLIGEKPATAIVNR